jgi:3-hydroxyacyl-CoA dehydrogenase
MVEAYVAIINRQSSFKYLMKCVGVIGTGTMGHGIAQIAAMSGYRVILYGRRQASIENAMDKIRLSLQKFMKKGIIRYEEVEKTLDRIKTTTSLNEEMSSVSIVIEAVTEDLAIKKDLYTLVEKKISDDTIISTTTSTIPISELQEGLNNPSRVIGTHFFNPPQIMKLVEIMGGKYTSNETLIFCVDFVRTLGKVPLILRREIPGYVANRILLSMFLTALDIVESGEAAPIEIDSILKYRHGFPMGLFELADFVGLDVVLNSLKILCRFDGTFSFSETIEKMVNEGRVGMKARRGFYEYSENGKREVYLPANGEKENLIAKIMLAGIREAEELVNMGVVDKDSIDIAVKLGLNLSKGIFESTEESRIAGMKELILT